MAVLKERKGRARAERNSYAWRTATSVTPSKLHGPMTTEKGKGGVATVSQTQAASVTSKAHHCRLKARKVEGSVENACVTQQLLLETPKVQRGWLETNYGSAR